MSEVESKRAATEEVLGEILKLMGIRARLEVKELPAKEAEGDRPAVPASISVALHLEEDVPGIVAGKRSQIVESMQFLANKITALGGEPTTGARPVPEASSNQEMLEAVLIAERKAVADYTQRARDAEAFGDKGLVVQLEDIVRDETGHAEETERILRDWPV